MLTDKVGASPTKQCSQNDGDENSVVECTDHGKEVWNEVERERQVEEERTEQKLVETRNPSVPHESRKENYAVGHEASKSSGVRPPADRNEHENEHDV